MCEVIVVSSGKGGVGKTTVSVNLGAALAEIGEKVCIIDADMGLRNLDIVLGVQDDVVYDFLDVYDGYCTLDQALIKVSDSNEMYILPAPQSRNCDGVEKQILEVCNLLRANFSYIIIDCPAGIDRGFKNAVTASDKAIIVTQCYNAAIRDADRAIDLCEQYGIKDIKLIINSVRPDLIKQKVMHNLDEIVDILGVELLGVIPEDFCIPKLLSEHKPVIGYDESIASDAYKNIVKRLKGEHIPITKFKKKKKKFKSIFKTSKNKPKQKIKEESI